MTEDTLLELTKVNTICQFIFAFANSNNVSFVSRHESHHHHSAATICTTTASKLSASTTNLHVSNVVDQAALKQWCRVPSISSGPTYPFLTYPRYPSPVHPPSTYYSQLAKQARRFDGGP